MVEVASAAPVSVVLVHGGFVDGSGWDEVYKILRKDGYQVSIVQNPTTSLADDVAATKRVIAEQKSPVVLVGHSYGGVVITEAGTDPRVASLVYIAAFAPDRGESVAALIKDPAPGAPVPPILPPRTDTSYSTRRSLRSVRGRCPHGQGRIHGELPGAVGSRGPHRRGHGAGVEEQAQLVPRRDRRQDDPASRPAIDVEASGRPGGRDQRQPRCLRLSAGRRCSRHQTRRRSLEVDQWVSG